jgi:epoxide hydrolase 4
VTQTPRLEHPAGLPEQLGFETAYFDLPGLRMHAAVAGPDDGPLVILLHGFPEFWYGWHRQIGPLAEAGFRVVVPDQRGYNLTGKTPPFDTRTLAADVVHLIEACGHRDALVAGHDWGALVAWTLAGLHPERVRRLAVLNVPHPSAASQEILGGNLRQILKSWYILFFQLPFLPELLLSRHDHALLRAAMKASADLSTFSEVDLDRYLTAWAQPEALSAMLGWYRALVRQALSQTSPNLERIAAPTLILWGARDAALVPELAQRSLEYVASGRLVRFPDATHWVQHDAAHEVSRLLLEHFRA